MSPSPQILQELFGPMLQQKRLAIEGLRSLCAQRACHSPPWWQWAIWLAHSIIVKRIKDA